jgi:hypothetical protein
MLVLVWERNEICGQLRHGVRTASDPPPSVCGPVDIRATAATCRHRDVDETPLESFDSLILRGLNAIMRSRTHGSLT